MRTREKKGRRLEWEPVVKGWLGWVALGKRKVAAVVVLGWLHGPGRIGSCPALAARAVEETRRADGESRRRKGKPGGTWPRAFAPSLLDGVMHGKGMGQYDDPRLVATGMGGAAHTGTHVLAGF